MKIDFVKSERTTKEWQGRTYQTLTLTYNLGKREVPWQFSTSVATKLLEAYESPKGWEDYQKHIDEKWSLDVVIPSWKEPFTFSPTKIQVFNHYIEDVKAFIRENAKQRKIITEPVVEMTEDPDTGDYVKTLYIPCWEKSEYEQGEGLAAMSISRSNAKYMFDTGCISGINIADIKAHFASDKADQPLVKQCVNRSGATYERKMSPEQVKAIIKYKNQISNFKDGLDINF